MPRLIIFQYVLYCSWFCYKRHIIRLATKYQQCDCLFKSCRKSTAVRLTSHLPNMPCRGSLGKLKISHMQNVTHRTPSEFLHDQNHWNCPHLRLTHRETNNYIIKTLVEIHPCNLIRNIFGIEKWVEISAVMLAFDHGKGPLFFMSVFFYKVICA